MSRSDGGSFGGLRGNPAFPSLGLCGTTLVGRYLVGTLRASGVNFVAPATGAAVLPALLNFLPALSLGPLADGMK
ncbi:hypothetical protein [Catenulispora pinisilvae]|uniref:hypothetical protein n=1 Tax=Catenulispora pinisilvae TaxID=2705253 RepID=UPI001892833D|nr:hypothetical protein [Catenulispora pinisilvae]